MKIFKKIVKTLKIILREILPFTTDFYKVFRSETSEWKLIAFEEGWKNNINKIWLIIREIVPIFSNYKKVIDEIITIWMK